MADNTTEQSVEQALAELREMFPNRVVDAIHHEGGFWTIGEGDELTVYNYWRVNVYGKVRDTEHPHLKFEAPTLNEAMDQVRHWIGPRDACEGSLKSHGIREDHTL